MRIYKGTLIIQLPRLSWQTKLLQKLGCKLHYFRLYKTVSFDMYAWSKVISIYRKRENEFYLSMQTTIVALLHIYVLYVRPFCVTVNQKDMLYKCKGGGYCKILLCAFNIRPSIVTTIHFQHIYYYYYFYIYIFEALFCMSTEKLIYSAIIDFHLVSCRILYA